MNKQESRCIKTSNGTTFINKLDKASAYERLQRLTGRTGYVRFPKDMADVTAIVFTKNGERFEVSTNSNYTWLYFPKRKDITAMYIFQPGYIAAYSEKAIYVSVVEDTICFKEPTEKKSKNMIALSSLPMQVPEEKEEIDEAPVFVSFHEGEEKEFNFEFDFEEEEKKEPVFVLPNQITFKETEKGTKTMTIMTKDREQVKKIALGRACWCYVQGSKGGEYIVRNIVGKLRVYDDHSRQIRPTKELQSVLYTAILAKDDPVIMYGTYEVLESVETETVETETAPICTDTVAETFKNQLCENGKSVAITEINGNPDVLEVPTKINGLPVDRFMHSFFGGKRLFDGHYFKRVVVPDSQYIHQLFAFKEHTDEIIAYSEDANGVIAITAVETRSDTFEIPAQICGKPVISVKEKAFSKCTNLKNIIIPENVTAPDFYEVQPTQTDAEMETGATGKVTPAAVFDAVELNDTTVTRASLHNENISGEERANGVQKELKNKFKFIKLSGGGVAITGFRKSENHLTLLRIPRKWKGYTVGEIHNNAFSGCTHLKNVSLPSQLKVIGVGAFKNCKNIENIDIPCNLFCIQDSTFYNCKKLQSITIPDTLCVIGDRAFQYCESLKSVTIPAQMREIKDAAFSDCTSLEHITFLPGTEKIGLSAFENCKSLRKIVIPDSVKYMDAFTFSGCTGLTSVTLPEGITEISGYTFKDCRSLEYISLPESVKKIGYGAFTGCVNLRNINFPPGVVVDPTAFEKTGCIKHVA